MHADRGAGRPAVIVIGSDDVGSAIAVALHRAGCAVVICDDVDPAWPRRGMSFTNAWYIGNAEVDGEGAVFCASVKSIPSVLDRRHMIAATTWSWPAVAAALRPAAIVDATLLCRSGGMLHKSRAPEDALTVGIFGGAPNVDVVVDGALGNRSECEPGAIVRAARSGRFATGRRIGDRVAAGEMIGSIGVLQVAAPEAGVLRGLSARGARIREGAEIVDVDRRGDPVPCFVLQQPQIELAREVLRQFELRGILGDSARQASVAPPEASVMGAA